MNSFYTLFLTSLFISEENNLNNMSIFTKNMSNLELNEATVNINPQETFWSSIDNRNRKEKIEVFQSTQF